MRFAKADLFVHIHQRVKFEERLSAKKSGKFEAFDVVVL
jgi:hypothetical protein